MDLINGAYDKILVEKDWDFAVRFIIENNFSAVQKKLAQYGIPVNSTLEAYIAVIRLNGTDAIKDILNVPYINEATNGTGGLATAEKRLFDGTFFNNVFTGLGNLVTGVGSGLSNVIGGVTGVIGTGGITGLTGTILTGTQGITAPLIGGIVPTQQNVVAPQKSASELQAEASKKNNTILFVIIGFILLAVIAFFLLRTPAKTS